MGVNSPTAYGVVTPGQKFQTDEGGKVIARGLVASADGTIDVRRANGSVMTDKMVFKGVNVFVCTEVVNAGGLDLEWFE